MIVDKTFKITLNIIGLPFYVINFLININKKQKEIGELVQVNSRKMHTIVSDNQDASYTVILDAGLSCCTLDWVGIQPEISKVARVVSFDRAGYGWSSSSKGKYTSKEVVGDLSSLLEKLSIKPPYILVGHSFGGLNMRLFASTYPEKVAALILIDSVHESRYIGKDWNQEREKAYKKSLKLFRLGYITSGIGLPRLIGQAVGRKKVMEAYQKHAEYIGYHPKSFEAVYKEFFYSEESANEVAKSNPLPKSLPLTMIRSNNKDPVWVEQQNMLSKLSNQLTIIETNNGHSVHLENQKLIVQCIKDTIKRLEEQDGSIDQKLSNEG